MSFMVYWSDHIWERRCCVCLGAMSHGGIGSCDDCGKQGYDSPSGSDQRVVPDGCLFVTNGELA